MSGFFGLGRADRCPHCGSEKTATTERADGSLSVLCLACRETHEREATGRLILPVPEEG